ncbi:DNA-binding response regulator [Clostridium sp. AF37-5]|nr:DNA-binding response regulator [Clostridium sp. AF37-5]
MPILCVSGYFVLYLVCLQIVKERSGEMKIRIACCDDEKQQLELYKTMFTNIEMRQDIKLNVEYFLSGNFMLERFQSEKNPFDLVYLDMDMDEKSGLDLAKEIRQNYHSDCLILFLTNYPKYMQNSFDVRAFQYMIKPVQFDEFERKFNAARKYLEKDDKNRVVLKIDEDNVVFFTNEIYYIEKEKSSKQFLVYLEDKCVVAKGVLSAIENQLLEQHFMRTHRSYLVNMKHIRRIQKNDLVLSNGNLVPISRRKEKELKQQFMRYAILER